jgi:hypothetical protein
MTAIDKYVFDKLPPKDQLFFLKEWDRMLAMTSAGSPAWDPEKLAHLKYFCKYFFYLGVYSAAQSREGG